MAVQLPKLCFQANVQINIFIYLKMNALYPLLKYIVDLQSLAGSRSLFNHAVNVWYCVLL